MPFGSESTDICQVCSKPLILQTLFIWRPWDLYGKLEYYQLNWVVAAMWSLNLVFSALWLRFYAFGPVEWAWRSLTYLRPAALRRPLSETQSNSLFRQTDLQNV
jgi:uncharacterized membrane protein YeiB